jgi:predicted transcriptional regulator
MEIKNSKKHTLFLPAFIDDYGFTPEEFRVFARIMRRSLGSQKSCYESIPQMAKTLKISEHLVRLSLRVLIDCGAITRTERPGKPDFLDFNVCDAWRSADDLEAIRQNVIDDFRAKDRQRRAAKRVVTDTQPVVVTDTQGVVVTDTQPVVVTYTQGEGIEDKSSISNEGNPKKVKTPTPPSLCEEQSTIGSDWRLRFFPALERAGLSPATTNELVDLFTFVAEQENRRTLIKERDWLDICQKLFNEGMSVFGVKSLYRYCKEIAQIKTVTPAVLDWKFAEYKTFLQEKAQSKPTRSAAPFNPDEIVLESSPYRGY